MKFQLPFRSPNRENRQNGNGGGGRTSSPAFGKKLLLLVLMTVLFTAVYFYCNQIGFWIIFPIYASVLTVLTLIFVIYNRAFTRKGLTEEMLPKDWDAEQKRAFLADGEERLARSRWMLYLITPLVFAMLFDLAYLWVSDLVGRGA